VVHPDREPRVYGGVQRDLDVIESVVESDPSDTQKCDPKAYLVLIPLAAADPVLSFVADTITLPITIPLQHKNDPGNHDHIDNTNPNHMDSATPAASSPSETVSIILGPPQSADHTKEGEGR
jgi:Protein of unknown function (DUF1375)